MKFIRTLAAATLLAALTAPAHAFNLGGVLNAATGLGKAATLSDDDVKAVARQSAEWMDTHNKVAPKGDKYEKRLRKIVAGLDNEDGMKLNFKVYLVRDINAFAMADGTVRVFSSLMDKFTDDEIRFVIGHEVGHVKLGHSKKALQVAYVASAARDAGAAAGGAAAALSQSELGNLSEKLVNAQFSQSQESDADAYAYEFMKRHNYDPHAAVSALRKLQEISGETGSASMFSSHPASKERAEKIEAKLK